MKQIQLTHGRIALVDDQDYKELSRFRWFAKTEGGISYAVRNSIADGQRRTIRMHTQIMNPPRGKVCDHINHNGLDNQRSNLRVCTHSENCKNQKKPRDAKTSQYKGVYFLKEVNKWRARIGDGGKYNLGRFLDEIEAARAYDLKARELYGEFACLNFPKEQP
jgi:hypothetical protein